MFVVQSTLDKALDTEVSEEAKHEHSRLHAGATHEDFSLQQLLKRGTAPTANLMQGHWSKVEDGVLAVTPGNAQNGEKNSDVLGVDEAGRAPQEGVMGTSSQVLGSGEYSLDATKNTAAAVAKNGTQGTATGASVWDAVTRPPHMSQTHDEGGRALVRMPQHGAMLSFDDVEPKLSNLHSAEFPNALGYPEWRLTGRGYIGLFDAVAVGQAKTMKRITLGRAHHVCQGRVHYTMSKRKDHQLQLALQPLAAPLVSAVVEKASSASMAALHQFFPNKTPAAGAGLSSRALDVLQRRTNHRFVVPHVLVWRLAAVYLAAEWSEVRGHRLEAVPDELPEQQHIRTVDEWAATVSRADQGGKMIYCKGASASGMEAEMLTLLTLALAGDMGLRAGDGVMFPSVVTDPPKVQAAVVVWLTERNIDLQPFRFNASTVWEASLLILRQYEAVELFRSYVGALAACWFSTDNELAPLYGSTKTTFTVPEFNMVDTLLLPFVAPSSAIEQATATVVQPQRAQLFGNGAAVGMFINAATHDLLCSRGARLARTPYLGDEVTAQLAAMTGMVSGGWCMLAVAAERAAHEAGMRGSLGGVLYGAYPDLRDDRKIAAWAADDLHAVQWEELMPSLATVSASSVLSAEMRPAILLKTPVPGRWMVRRNGGLADPNTWALLRSLSLVGANVGAYCVNADRSKKVVLQHQGALSYRGVRSDYSFPVYMHGDVMELFPAVMFPTPESAARAQDLFGVSRQREWYLQELVDKSAVVEALDLEGERVDAKVRRQQRRVQRGAVDAPFDWMSRPANAKNAASASAAPPNAAMLGRMHGMERASESGSDTGDSGPQRGSGHRQSMLDQPVDEVAPTAQSAHELAATERGALEGGLCAELPTNTRYSQTMQKWFADVTGGRLEFGYRSPINDTHADLQALEQMQAALEANPVGCARQGMMEHVLAQAVVAVRGQVDKHPAADGVLMDALARLMYCDVSTWLQEEWNEMDDQRGSHDQARWQSVMANRVVEVLYLLADTTPRLVAAALALQLAEGWARGVVAINESHGIVWPSDGAGARPMQIRLARLDEMRVDVVTAINCAFTTGIAQDKVTPAIRSNRGVPSVVPAAANILAALRERAIVWSTQATERLRGRTRNALDEEDARYLVDTIGRAALEDWLREFSPRTDVRVQLLDVFGSRLVHSRDSTRRQPPPQFQTRPTAASEGTNAAPRYTPSPQRRRSQATAGDKTPRAEVEPELVFHHPPSRLWGPAEAMRGAIRAAFTPRRGRARQAEGAAPPVVTERARDGTFEAANPSWAY